MPYRTIQIIGTFALLLALHCHTHAAEVLVAVAANFSAPMKLIAQAFEQQTGHRVKLSVGATSNFYTQINQGAPFDVFLAADDETPLKLEQEGLSVKGQRFTYATGKLVLWSKKPAWIDPQGDVLKTGAFDKIAIANPKLAPYGAAALQVLEALKLNQSLSPKLIEGANIAQTYQMVATENAALGFIALSQVYKDGAITQGSAWIVPAHLYQTIKQDTTLLNKGKNNPAAKALLTYLRSPQAQTIILSFGYELVP